MIQQIVNLPLRMDSAGSGEWGAPRGSRTHKGIDYVCTPGEEVLSPVTGKVTKHGYPYGDDLSWRYIEVTDKHDKQHRLFYVEPVADVGSEVYAGMPIAIAQDISQRYPNQGMKPHVHYEIKRDGEYLKPA